MSLKNVLLWFFFPALLLQACGSANRNQLSGALKGAWYKRYTGTIGGQPIVLNLHHYEDVTTGQYYYADRSLIIDLTDAEHDGNSCDLYLTELERTERREEDENFKPDHWAVNIDEHSIKGTVIPGDGTQAIPIDLKEDYGAGSFPLVLSVHEDSVKAKRGLHYNTAVSAYQVLEPGAAMQKDAQALVRKTVMGLLSNDSLQPDNIPEFIEHEDARYFDNYKRLLADMKVDKKEQQEDQWLYNFYHSRNIWAIYNDNNMLVLEAHEYDYSGGGSGRGNYINRYTCLDVQEKRVWNLNDIMNADAARLLPLLAKELRRSFRMKPGDTLTNRLTTDTVMLTNDFYLTGSGITFCYNPRLIGPESDGEICLFLPYNKLKDMLKDDFKKRMKLSN